MLHYGRRFYARACGKQESFLDLMVMILLLYCSAQTNIEEVKHYPKIVYVIT